MVDGSELGFKQRFQAFDAVKRIIELSEEFATGRPSPTSHIGKFLGDTSLLDLALTGNPSTVFGSGLWGEKELTGLSQSYKLPVYSASGPSLMQWMQKNIDESEIRMGQRFQEIASQPFAQQPKYELLTDEMSKIEKLLNPTQNIPTKNKRQR